MNTNRISRLPVRTSHLQEPTSRESRLSRTDNKRHRASSTSRISSTLCTPSLRRSKSSVSLKPTPQSVSRNRSSERKRIKKKDERPIQDKTWQAEMLQKTQYYFQHDPEGTNILNQGKNLRPITIKMFIELVNIILGKIDERFEELTTTNYVEILPKHLSKLMYPGSVTSSMMKTANTMHTWPHILAILSWLVDLHGNMQMTNAFIEKDMFVIIPADLNNHELQELQIKQLQCKTLMAAFVKWNVNMKEEDEFENYLMDLRKIYNIDDDDENCLKQEQDQLSRLLKTDEEQILKLNEEIKEEELEYRKLLDKRDYLDNLISQQEDYIRRAEQNIIRYKKDNKVLAIADEKSRIKNEKLEEKIKLQPMTKNEKENHLRQIKELNAKKDLIIKERKLQQQIGDETDLRISQLRLKIEEEVSAYNIKLLEPSLKHPELKECILKCSSVFGAEFYKNVEEKPKILEKLHADLEEKFKVERNALDTIEKEVNQKQKEVDKILKENKELKLKTEEIKQNIESTVATVEENIGHKNTTIASIKNKIKDVHSEFLDTDKIREMMRQRAKEYFELKNQYEDEAQRMLKLSEKLEHEVVEHIIPGNKDCKKRITEAVIKRRNRFHEFFTGASTSTSNQGDPPLS